MNLVDSSGWLEYFSNSKNADYFAPVIEDTNNLLVSTINIYEVFKKILKERDENSALKAVALMYQGTVKDIDSTVSLLAAKLSFELKLPMADSLILATARLYKATLWTQNSDFRNIEGVNYKSK
ncbi:MAG: type II toxin-antitoxin system VapC family toxin [Thermodesulfobacteriota bacterium]